MDSSARNLHTLHPHTRPSMLPFFPICQSTAFTALTHPPHLYQHVGCIVETHDQGSHSCHVVHVGKGDEGDCCHMVQEHDQEILKTQSKRNISHNLRKRKRKCLLAVSSHACSGTCPEHRVQCRRESDMTAVCTYSSFVRL